MSDYLGEFEHIILLALLQLGKQAYGVAVRKEINERTGRDPSIGSVYSTLDRLEKKGLVRSRTGDPTPTRGGRARKFFEVTAEGQHALARSRALLERMADGLQLEWES